MVGVIISPKHDLHQCLEKNLLNKGRRYNYIKDVPIWLTKDNNNGLKGALNAINNPHYKDKVSTK